MVSSRQLRVMRGAVASTVATFVALLSHVIGGGEIPGGLGILIPLMLSLPVSIILAGRRLSLWRLSLSVALSQVLFHFLFVLGTPSTGALPATMHAGHSMPGDIPIFTTPSASPPPAGTIHAAGMMHGDAQMWIWHGIAALVTVAALYRGERALIRLRELATQIVSWFRQRATVTVTDLAPLPIVRALAPGWSTVSLADSPELSPWRRRGPPVTHTV